MIDPKDIGGLAMRFLDHIHEGYGEDAELIRTLIIAEVRYPDDHDPETVHHTVLWDTNEQSIVARAGLAQFVAEALLP